jgi:glyoxylase-like metal-dependent hydrolase (beta-lactamase superfamily II)
VNFESLYSEARYRWTLLRAGQFKLDGGSMFGLIPRTVWSKSVPTDDRGRITVQHNCILLERVLEDSIPPLATSAPSSAPSSDGPDPAPSLGGGAKFALIEVGTGDKLDDASRELFDMEPRTILTALAEVGRRPEDIGAVVVSHLHFDHAGGLTRLALPHETPDWVGPAGGMAKARPDHGVKLSFPYAVVFCQQREWDDALANRSVMTRTYFRDHLEPLASRTFLIDSPPPFALDYIPGRDELPFSSLPYRETYLPGLPGVSVFRVPGHTWGQQAVKFFDEHGRAVVFTPDVMPTASHLGAAYNLGYDVEPYTSMVSRHWLLDEAAARHWVLVLDHEPGHPCFRVERNGKGWFNLRPEPIEGTSHRD